KRDSESWLIAVIASTLGLETGALSAPCSHDAVAPVPPVLPARHPTRSASKPIAPGVAVTVGALPHAASTRSEDQTTRAFFTPAIVSAGLLNPACSLVASLRK